MADVTVRFPSGIPGVSLGEVERTIPAEEPPPLPTNDKLAVIGKPTPRIDGRQKVTGAARYTADVRLPGMLFARAVRSPHPHAKITAIDTSAAERIAGVRAVHVLDHVYDMAKVRDASKELPSKYPIVRYIGQPIAAVAATSQTIADEAARAVKVTYEALPFVVDMDAARAPNAPLVFPAAADEEETAGGGGSDASDIQKGNVRGPVRRTKGDVAKGFAEADVIVEARYRTQVQTHCALETHGVVAHYAPDGLTVYASTQSTSSVRDELAAVFGLAKSKVRVVTEYMGGGFGAKFGAGHAGVLATHLSKKAGAPVRLMLDRREEHLAAGNRPSSVQELKIGAKKDGTLTALQLVAYGTAGTGTGAGVSGPARNLYPCPNHLIDESDVFMNAGSGAAFRAPGHPQGAFALEQSLDELAEKLRIDPLALRDKIDVDEPGATQLNATARRAERRIGAELIGWSRRRPPGSDPGPIKRGIGVAQGVWYRFVDRDSACEVRIHKDGSVELFSAVQDIGGGIRTVLAQVVAEELGLAARDVTVRIGDTAYPIGTSSGGSRTTGSMTPAARGAAYQAKRQMFDAVAAALGVRADDLDAKAGKVFPKADPSRALTFRAAAAKLATDQVAARASRLRDYGGFAGPTGGSGIGGSGGVQFAEVHVDTETGIVKVDRVVAVHDCGRPMNRFGLENQINGGILQGISYALYENRQLDRNTGHMVNANLEQYKIAGAREVPQIDVRIIEEYRGRSSTDAGGIGEPATVPTAAAVANAVYNATGVRIRELPMTPPRVLAALAARGSQKDGGVR